MKIRNCMALICAVVALSACGRTVIMREGTKRQAKFVNIYTDFNIYGLLRSDIMGERAAST